MVSWAPIENSAQLVYNNGWVMAKKHMPKYGHAGHFWPLLMNIVEWNYKQHHLIFTINLHVLCNL